jgi:hypothetical protein
VTDNQKWHQVFKLRSDQTIAQLFELIPIIARNTENHLNWLGPGYYFWKEEEQALDWGGRYHKCKSTDLVIVSVLIEITTEMIFDPQEVKEHKSDFEKVRDYLLRERKKRGRFKINERVFVSDCMKLMLAQDTFRALGFRAAKYRDHWYPNQLKLNIKMAEHTPTEIFLEYSTMLCVFEPFKNTITNIKVVFPKEKY